MRTRSFGGVADLSGGTIDGKPQLDWVHDKVASRSPKPRMCMSCPAPRPSAIGITIT